MNFVDWIVDRAAQVILPRVVKLVNQSNSYGRHGFVLKGSWDPSDGTVTVVLADTIFADPTVGDAPVILTKVPVAVPHTGDQYGFIGDERLMVYRTQSGWFAKPNHDPIDSIGAPAGEHWKFHRNPSTGEPDLQIKMTNDGSVPGSGTAGLLETGAAYFKRATAGGHTDTFDDNTSTKAMTRTSSAGHTFTMNDVLGALHMMQMTAGGLQHILDDETEEVASIASKIALGMRYADMTGSNNLFNNEHITTLMDNLKATRAQDMSTICAAIASSAIPNGTTIIAAIEGLSSLPSLLTIADAVLPLPTIPDGSSVARCPT